MNIRKRIGLAGLLALGAAAAGGQIPVVTHWDLQSVNSTGYTTWVESFPFTIRGVVVNDPEEMLDPAFNPEATSPPTGGQYQMFIQAVAEGDRGGTALFMAQRSFLGDHYDQAAWSNEMQRVMFDGNGRKFRKGDLVEVTARKAIFFNGKRNINEAHRTLMENNFDIALVQPNVGLPRAEAITLADLKDAGDGAIFDPDRGAGGEHWQGMRVRLDGIRLADTNGWGQAAWSNRLCTAVDDTGRSLPLRLPRTDLDEPPSTSAWFSAVGILNQESVSNSISGYELFVQEIEPVLEFGRSSSGGVAVSFSADYEGFVLEASDDGLENWNAVDATPKKVIVAEDEGNLPNRIYRLRKTD